MSANKIPKFHKDLLGREIVQGDFVAAPYQNSLTIFKVSRLTPKMLKLSNISVRRASEVSRYPHDSVLLPPDDVTFHILSKG